MSQFIEMFGDQNTNDKQWAESLVKDEFKLSMGKTPARSNPECWENGTHKWISISDMAIYTRYTGDTSEYITDYAITDSGIKVVPKGTIIMSFKLSIGRTAITSEDIYTNEAIMAFTDFDKKKFNIDFLHFLIANKNWLLGAKQAVKGQTLNKESIGNAKIVIPPIALQEEFAQIYNQADKSKFGDFKSQFIEMFGGLCQDTPWSDVVTITNGKAYPEEYQEEGAYPICGSGGIMCYGEKKLCNGNTTILGRKGNINNPIFMESGYWIVDTAFSIDVDKAKLHPKFFYYWCCQYDFTKLNKQGVLPSLTRKDLEKVKMAIPQMRDQLKFVSIAEQADKSKSVIQKALVYLNDIQSDELGKIA